ncbi:MAG: hypothetical protein JKX71_12235 [Amylibacter sp.]|nr:hypothetical protein [Amylibacter sp.]
MRRRFFLGIFCSFIAAFLLITSSAFAAGAKFPKPRYVTGGSIKFPYSLQPGDQGNTYFETFFKASLPVWKANKSELSFFIRGFYSRDSLELTFNNRSKISIGMTYSIKLHKTFSVSASIKYDHDFRFLTGKKKSGFRGNISYFYYNSRWRNKPGGHKGWFRQKTWARAWGVFTFPESLDKGDRNLAFITGLEAAAAYVRPKGKLQYVPFAELTIAFDVKKKTFNNKIIPAIGFKFRRPVKGGEFSLGIKYAIDRRWIKGTTEYGMVVFGGWYKAF